MSQTRFFRRGKSKVHFLPAVANLAAPSRAEITAGIDISDAIAGIGGFNLANTPITTPDLATQFDSQIDGVDAVDDSSLTFYDDLANSDVREAVAKGTDGFLLLLPYGDTPSKRCETWPVRSTGVNDAWSLDATAAQFNVGFAVTDKPEQNAVVPAAT